MGTCKWCSDGYAINTTTGKCVNSSITNCNKFISTQCLQCRPGYKISSSLTRCNVYCFVKNCNKCSGGPCTECKAGFTLITTAINSQSVQVCVLNSCSVANCTYCDSNDICLQCKSGFFLNSTDKSCYNNCTIAKCVSCTAGSTTCL